jgi:hypothetical protein
VTCFGSQTSGSLDSSALKLLLINGRNVLFLDFDRRMNAETRNAYMKPFNDFDTSLLSLRLPALLAVAECAFSGTPIKFK